MNKVTDGIPQQFWNVLRWVVTIAAFGYLYFEIFIQHDAHEIAIYAQTAFNGRWWFLLLVVLLMPLNWGIEAIKWRILLVKFHPLPIAKSIKGILLGISVGIFTPNGIGEFMGRMLVIPNKAKQASVSATIVGNMSQLAITITMGGACLVYFIGTYIAEEFVLLAAISALATVVLGVFLYFKMPQFAKAIFSKFAIFSKYNQFVSAFDKFTRKDLLNAYLLSLLRYLVFCLQLYVLLSTTVHFTEAISSAKLFFLIPVYYYVQTIVPTISLGELGVRGAALLYVLPESQNGLAIVMCTTIIWLINLIIPAILGLMLSFFTKLKLPTV